MRRPSFAKHDIARECARNKISISLPTTSKPMEKSGKSGRLRRMEHPLPKVGRGNFAEDEEELLIRLHALLGNRWSLIAGRLPGRTSSEVQRYWNAHLRKKLMSMGIDPDNHHVRPTLASPTLLGPAMKQECMGGHRSGSKTGNDQMHDAASDQEDNASLLPDLNLDLSISIPSSQQLIRSFKPQKKEAHEELQRG